MNIDDLKISLSVTSINEQLINDKGKWWRMKTCYSLVPFAGKNFLG